MLERHEASDGRVWWVRILTILAILLVLAAAGTTVRMALRTGLDLAVLGSLCVLAWLAFQILPRLGRYIEARLFNARLADARKRPVAELMARHLERRDQLRRDKEALTTLVGQLHAMRELVARQQAHAPSADLTMPLATLQRLTELVDRLTQRCATAERALAQEKEVIERKRFEHEFSEAGKRVAHGLWTAKDREGVVMTMVEEEAMRTIDVSFAEALAGLEFSARAEDPPPTASSVVTGMTPDPETLPMLGASQAKALKRGTS